MESIKAATLIIMICVSGACVTSGALQEFLVDCSLISGFYIVYQKYKPFPDLYSNLTVTLF